MGGSGSGGSGGNLGGGGGNFPRRDFDECESIRFETVLMSPQAEGIHSIAVGDVLSLEFRDIVDQKVVAAINTSRQLVGTVGSAHAVRLRSCMESNHNYVAEVLSINSGACQVLIHLLGR